MVNWKVNFIQRDGLHKYSHFQKYLFSINSSRN